MLRMEFFKVKIMTNLSVGKKCKESNGTLVQWWVGKHLWDQLKSYLINLRASVASELENCENLGDLACSRIGWNRFV
jgi:hypothetical protein